MPQLPAAMETEGEEVNLEALGRTYHGGAPAPLQPGDLVTSRDAPEGCPSWVGEVPEMDASFWVPPRVYVRELGYPYPYPILHDACTVRPLTDLEAVGLAEMLAGGRWDPFAGETWSLLGSGEDDAVVMLAAPHQWRCLPADGAEVVGRATSVEAGMAAASRALILYTIRGKK